MRNMLSFLAAAVIAVGAAGYYFDWYSVRTKPTKDGHRKIVVDVNADKISETAHNVEQKLAEKAEKAKKEKESAAPKPPESQDVKHGRRR